MPAGDPPSMADFLTKAGSLSGGRAPFPARDPVDTLVGYARHNYDDLVDAAAHKASFDSPAFVQMLDQFKALTDANPAPADAEAGPAFADLMNGKGSYAVVDLRSPMELGLARTVLGDDLALCSLPTLQGGDAHDFEPGMLLGVNTAAKDQKMAFEVLKTMLSDTVQSGIMEGLPVLKSACEEAFTRMADGSQGMKMRAVLMMGDKQIEVKPLTAEDIALATAKIGGLNRALIVDSAVTAVLKEELPAFFSGQKTAQEVAGLIQNRVTTMLNE
jgi:multiple sugar transport system substrate-binding protein